MQGFKTLVFLVLVVALFGLASAAPSEDEPTGLQQLEGLEGVERTPAMLVRGGEPAAPAPRRCTAANCRSLCRALGWRYGRCLDAVWCMCYN